MRRHGWQRPLHPLQMVGMAVYGFLVVAFYCFLGLFLGNRIAEITITTIFSTAALLAMFTFIRCAAIDPSDKTRIRKKKRMFKSNGLLKLNYGFILRQIITRFFRRLERNILRNFIRRKYLDPWQTSGQMEPLLPFPLVMKDDAVAPDPNPTEAVISFCSICNFEVKKHSKHCRTCNRCVEGFDHHCRWLNNCVGKKNYTTFILLMTSVLLMLIIEGGTAVAIFIRCFADTKGIEQEMQRKLHIEFPRGFVAAISVLLVLMTAYSSAALGQLFFFHMVLIRKGMRTYDYILAMREESQSMELESLEDSDFSSDESVDFGSPEKPTFVSQFICRESRNNHQNSPRRLSIKIDGEPEAPKQGFRASIIDPWKLINMSREKALLAAGKARERLMKHRLAAVGSNSLRPLPLETKSGPMLLKPDRNVGTAAGSGLTPLVISGGGRLPVSPGRFSSPRRRFSSSPTVVLSTSAAAAATSKHKYKNSFDLRLSEVSRELDTYISRQVLCSVLKEDGSGVSSPR